MTHPVSFYVPWTAALAASATQPAATAGATMLHFEGMTIPVVQAVLAIAGVLIARPLAHKKESSLPLSHFLIVTVIMLVIALAWVAQSQPNVLFTFVVAVGLGFSGYSLIETAGDEIEAAVRKIIAAATDALTNIGAG